MNNSGWSYYPDVDPRNGLPDMGAGYGFRPGFGRHHLHGYPSVPSPENWVRLGWLLGLCCVSCVGTIGNIYTIACCVVGDRLRKKGSVFLVNLSLVMLMMTLLVLPSIAFHIMSGKQVSSLMCRAHESVAVLSGCVALFTLLAIALESHVRTSRRRLHHRLLNTWRVCLTLAVCWLLGGALYLTFLLSTDVTPSVCSATYSPAFSAYRFQRHIVLVSIIGGTTALTAVTYIYTWLRVRQARSTCTCQQTRPAVTAMLWDIEVTRANVAVWLSFLFCWSPIAVGYAGAPWLTVSASFLRAAQWPPLLHAAFSNLFYVIFSEDFRESYANLARYCFCKVSVDFSKRQRTDVPRPLLIETRNKSVMRVHLLSGYGTGTALQTAGGRAPSHQRRFEDSRASVAL